MQEVKKTHFSLYMANADNAKDILYLKHQLAIDSEILTYAADKNELSHLEYDRDDKTLLLIYNVLDISKQDFHYRTVPITFFVYDNNLITIYKDKSAYIVKQMEVMLDKNEGSSLYQFLFTVLYLVSKNYFPTVDHLNLERNRLNNLLRERTSKKELL